MSGRGAAARLAALYGMMERMRSAELRTAAAAVDEVQVAGAIAAAACDGQAIEARAALAAGNREDWQVAVTTREMVEVRISRLAALKQQRELTMEEAAVAHRTSRLQMEQMGRVVELRLETAGVEELRRMQAESDDRFGARLAWKRGMKSR